MKKRNSVAFVLLLGSALAAQNTLTVPSGYKTTEAPNYNLYFGSRSAMRAQIHNGDHRGTVKLFTKVAFRQDGGRSASSSYFAARDWANVRLIMAESDYNNLSTTWTANHKANVKTVLNSKVS